MKRFSILVGLAAAAIIFTGCGESLIDSAVGDDGSQEIVPTTTVLYADDWGEPASGVAYQCGSDIVKVTGSDGMMHYNMGEWCTLYGLDETVSLTTNMNEIYLQTWGFPYSCESGLSGTVDESIKFTFDPFWIPADPTLPAGDVCVLQFDVVL